MKEKKPGMPDEGYKAGYEYAVEKGNLKEMPSEDFDQWIAAYTQVNWWNGYIAGLKEVEMDKLLLGKLFEDK